MTQPIITVKTLDEISHYFRGKSQEAQARERSMMNGPPTDRPTRQRRAMLQAESATWRAAAEFIEMCRLEETDHG